MLLFATGLGGLNLSIFRFESARSTLSSENFLDEGSFPLFVGQPSSEELGWALDDRAHL